MRTHISLPSRTRRAFTLALLVVAFALPSLAADMPLAAGSPLAGFSFDDQPLSLPVQQNFQMALLTTSTELGRSCGKMEAYGWRMKQTEQQRVDTIFNSTVDRLRAIGYVVETQTPASVSRDVTLFTADRQDKHFIFMWSAGEIGLVMVLCQSTPPMVNNHSNTTATYAAHMPQVHSFPMPDEVLTSELKTPVRDKAAKEAVSHFSPVGKWVGSYSCMQGYTGGTLDITSLNGRNFKGSFHFYPTRKNPRVASGSYNVFGQYDHVTHRILINPGKWIKRPRGYADTIIVGDFDPAMHSFSGFFQGITGCTSFEAKLAGPSHVLSKAKTHKKKAAATKPVAVPSGMPVPANSVLTPPEPAATPASAAGGPPSPGIPVGQPAAAVPPPSPTPAPLPAAPPMAPPRAPAPVTPALQPPLPTQMPPPAAAPAPTTPAAMPPGQ